MQICLDVSAVVLDMKNQKIIKYFFYNVLMFSMHLIKPPAFFKAIFDLMYLTYVFNLSI